MSCGVKAPPVSHVELLQHQSLGCIPMLFEQVDDLSPDLSSCVTPKWAEQHNIGTHTHTHSPC